MKNQSILRHCIHDPRKWKHGSKHACYQANHPTNCHNPLDHRPTDLFENIRQRGVDILSPYPENKNLKLFVVSITISPLYLQIIWPHKGENCRYSEICKEYDKQGEHDSPWYSFARIFHFFTGCGNAIESYKSEEAGGRSSDCSFETIREETTCTCCAVLWKVWGRYLPVFDVSWKEYCQLVGKMERGKVGLLTFYWSSYYDYQHYCDI